VEDRRHDRHHAGKDSSHLRFSRWSRAFAFNP
jgi:hypothetical protein